MRIAVIAKTRLPVAEPFRGGLEAFTHALCHQYIALGHDITLYAHADSDPALSVKGFYGNEFRDSSFYEIYESDEYLSILKDIEQQDFDIVHNNATHELPMLWKIRSKIPMVTTLHTPPIAKLKAALIIASKETDIHLAFPSESFRAQWQPYFNGNSRVIYNGADTDQWNKIRESQDYLFWYGRIVHAKGLDIVIDVANALNLNLKFAGPKDDLAYFETFIEPKLSSNIEYLGHLPQTEIHKHFKNTAATVSAVRWEEPFGLTNVEAMLSGVPVAGFDRGAFSELIHDKSGIVAEQCNVEALSRAVQSAMLLKSDDVSAHAQKFSLRTMAENYIQFFEEII